MNPKKNIGLICDFLIAMEMEKNIPEGHNHFQPGIFNHLDQTGSKEFLIQYALFLSIFVSKSNMSLSAIIMLFYQTKEQDRNPFYGSLLNNTKFNEPNVLIITICGSDNISTLKKNREIKNPNNSLRRYKFILQFLPFIRIFHRLCLVTKVQAAQWINMRAGQNFNNK